MTDLITRETSDITPIVSPDSINPILRDLIADARHELLIYLYDLSSPHLIEAIERRAAEPNPPRIRIMLEPRKHFTRFASSRHRKARERLAAAVGPDNIHQAPSYSSPVRAFALCHQKFAVVDRRRVFLASGNWDTRLPDNRELPADDGSNWSQIETAARDWAIIVDNPAVAEVFANELFEHDWNLKAQPRAAVTVPTVQAVQVFSVAPVLPSRLFPPPDRPYRVAGHRLRLATSPDLYHNAALELIDGAESALAIQQIYITRRSHSGGVNTLLDAIVRAHQRGVQVRLMLEPDLTLIPGGNKLDELQLLYDAGLGPSVRFRATNRSHENGLSGPPRLPFLHNKGIIADGKRVLVTSTNWSDFSVERNREAGLVISHAWVARYFQRVFDLDWEDAAFHLPDLGLLSDGRVADPLLPVPRSGDTDQFDPATTYVVEWTEFGPELV